MHRHHWYYMCRYHGAIEYFFGASNLLEVVFSLHRKPVKFTMVDWPLNFSLLYSCTYFYVHILGWCKGTCAETTRGANCDAWFLRIFPQTTSCKSANIPEKKKKNTSKSESFLIINWQWSGNDHHPCCTASTASTPPVAVVPAGQSTTTGPRSLGTSRGFRAAKNDENGDFTSKKWRFPWPWGYPKIDGLFHGKSH